MMTGDKPGLQGYDEEQVQMMEENCIVVDKDDNIIGPDTKVNCHLGEGKLHRAFSVLLFNSSGELLIQKRAAGKITFPSIWANSCCSHPLHIDKEIEGIEGAKLAAKRKMEQELGIDQDLIDSNQLCFITKMHYRARADEKWVEHEIDYIFALNCDVETKSNPNEIAELKYVTEDELQELFNQGEKIGPWFRLIKENFLNKILNEPENSLPRQYAALMATEDVTLSFTKNGIDAIASFAHEVNHGIENIGARRLHTVMERLLEDISFTATDKAGIELIIDESFVRENIGDLVSSADLSKFIL